MPSATDTPPRPGSATDGGSPPVTGIEAAVYTIPTDAPEAAAR
jgi:hypothetical protein